MMRLARAVTVALAAFLLLGCGTENARTEEEKFTRFALEYAWQDLSTEEKAKVCVMRSVLGEEEFVDRIMADVESQPQASVSKEVSVKEVRTFFERKCD